jgi:arginyl-tRNA synthetase
MRAEGITGALKEALAKLGIEGIEPTLEHPAELTHGDFSTNIALAAAKREGLSPKALAEKIVAELSDVPGVSKIEIAGPGFINFHLSREVFAESVGEILKAKKWGAGDMLSGENIIVEYAQPNPFKPFHIGHLMSTTIGESISRLVEYMGATLFRANYQGDIGPHVAKCLWGLQKEGLDASNVDDLGKAYVAGNSAYEDDPAAKAEIDDINKRLYAGDPALQEAYDAGRKASLAHFDELYSILGTHFDHLFFESETAPVGKKLVESGLARGVFEESDGAIVYKGEKVGLHTRVFITKQGTPTYETKELGLVELKQKAFPFDVNITTVAVEQDGYFKVVEAALAELEPERAGKYTHATFGMMQLTSGKMSSRKGNVITGESLIEDMRVKALEKMEGRDLGDARAATADAVAVAAIKYSILKQTKGKNIIFDPEASLSFEGDSGPYLQYSYVRALSVLKKAKEEHILIYGDMTNKNKKKDEALSYMKVPEDVSELERLLYRFPEVVVRAEEEKEPHYITTFLTELAGAFNSWYAQEKIVDAEDPTSPYKVALTQAFAATMKNGLWLLGIEAPERM